MFVLFDENLSETPFFECYRDYMSETQAEDARSCTWKLDLPKIQSLGGFPGYMDDLEYEILYDTYSEDLLYYEWYLPFPGEEDLSQD